MIICFLILLISARIAGSYYELDTNIDNEPIGKEIVGKYKEYFKDIKLGFSFVFSSRRLKSLMLFAGIMYGIIAVLNTYEMGLLQEIDLSSTMVGLIYATMQVVAGIASKKQDEIHNKFRNKTLTVTGISYTIACLLAGIICMTNLDYRIVILVVIFTYTIRYIDTGAYFVLIKKYITNFTNSDMIDKVYSAYGIVTGLGNTLICIVGTIIVGHHSLRDSMAIFGILFLIVILLILQYMKTRVGLKPEEYRKKDIDFKEFVNSKLK